MGSWEGKRLDVDGFLRTMERSGPPPSLFLAGPEVLLRDEIIHRLQKVVARGDENDSRWSRENHSARETALSEVVGGLRVVGLFAETRLVIVTEAERYGRVSQTDRSDLWHWLAQPTEGIHLVLCTEKPLWEMERGNEFLKGTLQRVAAAVRLDHPTAEGAVQIVRRIGMERYNLQISPMAAGRLVEAIGPNLLELRQEIERLAIRLGPGEKVDEATLENWLRSGIIGRLGDLERAILSGDLEKALRHWDALRPSMTVPSITWTIGSRHLDPRWARQGQERIPDRAFLSRVLHECYVIERGVKSGDIPSSLQEIVFEETIWRLWAARRRSSVSSGTRIPGGTSR